MNKATVISLIVSAALIGGAFALSSSGGIAGERDNVVPVAEIIDGKQFIDISAKGGYSPRVVKARARIPTTLRVATNGTFDCSASLVIPKLSYQKFLQPSGVEEIEISADRAQGMLQGLCSMGMYNFRVLFE